MLATRPFLDENLGVGYLYRVFRATEEENRRAILAALEPRTGARLLDLGTSRGDFTMRVAGRLGAASGADLDDGLPFEDGAFDVVHANQVIEHVRRTDTFLRETRRVLAPDGLACISTNNLSSWHNVFSLALGYQPMPMHVSDETILGNPLNPLDGRPHADRGRTHLRLFTARALIELCARHGLEAVSLRTAGYYPLPPPVARVAGRVDPTHAAFLIGLFRPS